MLINAKGGTITANQKTALTITPNQLGVSNAGVLQAINGHTLILNGKLVNDANGQVLSKNKDSVINLNGTVTNAGMIQASDSGTLTIADALLNNPKGTVAADGKGSSVTLNGKVTNASTIQATNGATLTIAIGLENQKGTVEAVGAGSTVNLSGKVTNAGTIQASAGTLNFDGSLGNQMAQRSRRPTVGPPISPEASRTPARSWLRAAPSRSTVASTIPARSVSTAVSRSGSSAQLRTRPRARSLSPAPTRISMPVRARLPTATRQRSLSKTRAPVTLPRSPIRSSIPKLSVLPSMARQCRQDWHTYKQQRARRFPWMERTHR